MLYYVAMKDLVVKHNALTTASYSLSLTEQRLILLAIVSARSAGKGIDSIEPLVIHASHYMQQFDVAKHTAYEMLKEAVSNLFNRQFSYMQPYNNSFEKVTSRWVSKISYRENEATVTMVFAPDVVPLVTELERNFTHYAIEQISELSSAYAVRMYEILISWRGTQETGLIELDELRNRLGIAEDEYTRMSDFKRRVLDLAINQINEHTDITAQYRQHKKGRKIIGFNFDFKFKKTKTPSQAKHHYTRADLEQNSALALPGESYEQALKRLNAKQH